MGGRQAPSALAPQRGPGWMAKACRGPVRTGCLALASPGCKDCTGGGKGGRLFPSPWGSGWPQPSSHTPEALQQQAGPPAGEGLQHRCMHMGEEGLPSLTGPGLGQE